MVAMISLFPVDIAARLLRFAHEIVVKPNGFVRLLVKTRHDRQPAGLREIRQDLLATRSAVNRARARGRTQ